LVVIYNSTRDRTLAHAAALADTVTSRMKGLLGRDSLPEGEGMVIDPCNQIHTFFMRFPIDVAFVDAEGRIVRQLEAMKPWRMSGIYFRARRVIELPAGVLAATGTREGDVLTLRPDR
jgi:hypothetical protein